MRFLEVKSTSSPLLIARLKIFLSNTTLRGTNKITLDGWKVYTEQGKRNSKEEKRRIAQGAFRFLPEIVIEEKESMIGNEKLFDLASW